MEYATQRALRDESRAPEIVETPPPDPETFPPIVSIRPDHPILPPNDLVHIVRRAFRKSQPAETHRPGELLAFRIAFQGHPQFQTVALHFRRDEKKSSRYENQLCLGIGLGTQGQAVPEDDGSYEVKGTILKCAPGKYRVIAIGAFGFSGTDRAKLYFKDYFNGTDFRSDISLKLTDTMHRTFPAIVSVVADAPAF